MGTSINFNKILGFSKGCNIIVPTTPAVDPDAQAFITAANITNPTQQGAINQLVLDLKGYGIWTKMKAIYPIVGGTASTHKWNLKDPRDLDAAYRLTFTSGWTHSTNGMTPSNAYADTFLTPSTSLSLNSAHLSYYSRTNSNGTEVEIGVNTSNYYNLLEIRTSGTTYFLINQNGFTTASDSDSRGFYLGNRQASNDIDGWRQGVKVVNGTAVSGFLATHKIFIGAYNNNGSAGAFTTKQCAFASIGDGLSDTEAANFYTAVQAFQTTLGRSIGTQTVSDADAQAFINAAAIDDQVQADAINNLVIGLKADSLWTKFKAIYPVVGGVASAHSVNLKTPGTYNLTFASGWTHSANGMQNNAVAYSNTFLNMSTQISSVNNWAAGFYSNLWVSGYADMGADTGVNNFYFTTKSTLFGANVARFQFNDAIQFTDTTGTGFYLGTRNSSTNAKAYKNAVEVANLNNASAGTFANLNVYLGAVNRNGSPLTATNVRYAFCFIANASFSATEQSNFYTAVQAFQTSLSRNV